ncbi:hypothetical protein D3C87_1573260 [compost metagenome]
MLIETGAAGQGQRRAELMLDLSEDARDREGVVEAGEGLAVIAIDLNRRPGQPGGGADFRPIGGFQEAGVVPVLFKHVAELMLMGLGHGRGAQVKRA